MRDALNSKLSRQGNKNRRSRIDDLSEPVSNGFPKEPNWSIPVSTAKVTKAEVETPRARPTLYVLRTRCINEGSTEVAADVTDGVVGCELFISSVLGSAAKAVAHGAGSIESFEPNVPFGLASVVPSEFNCVLLPGPVYPDSLPGSLLSSEIQVNTTRNPLLNMSSE
jgi:hypothetical protein